MIQPTPGKPELYDLADDPMETRDLADQQPNSTRDLVGRLDAWVQSVER